MKKLFLFLSLLLLSLPFVYAIPGDQELLIPQGQDSSLSLPMFSRTTVRIFEGTTLEFNIVNGQGNALINNRITLQKISKTKIKVLLSVDSGEPQERILDLGNETTLSYNNTYSNSLPFMVLRPMVSHDSEDPKERNIVLFFNVPFLTSQEDLKNGANTGYLTVSPDQIKPTQVTKQKLNPFLFISVLSVLILGIGIFLFFSLKKNMKKK